MIVTPVRPDLEYLWTCVDFERERDEMQAVERAMIAEALAGPWNPLPAILALAISLALWGGIVALGMWVWRLA